MQALLDVNDPDWVSFNEGDPEYLLRVCGQTIRDYCGWHIYPNITQLSEKLHVGSRGKIMLPSLYVTDVSSVVMLGTGADTGSDVSLPPEGYEWFQQGYIEPAGWQWFGAFSGYYYGPDQWSYLPVYQFGLADVTFTHGYDAVPDAVKQVAYELTNWAQTVKPGSVKEIASPGFRLMLGGNPGMNLNADQKNRLAPYRIPGVI